MPKKIKDSELFKEPESMLVSIRLSLVWEIILPCKSLQTQQEKASKFMSTLPIIPLMNFGILSQQNQKRTEVIILSLSAENALTYAKERNLQTHLLSNGTTMEARTKFGMCTLCDRKSFFIITKFN